MDDASVSIARARIVAWRDTLRGTPGLAEAERLRDSVVDPATASVEEVWRALWDKPLYAYTRVEVAERGIAALEPWMPGAWEHIGRDPAVLLISYERRSGKDVYSGEGHLLAKARTNPLIGLHRLYRIQSGAAVLRDWARRYGETPARHLAGEPLRILVPQLKSELGRGWGHITVLHLLTDLGIAVKPDLHLARAVRELGLCDPKVGRVPSLSQAIRINEAVAALAGAFGEGPQALRYTDKVLMEASRQRLFADDVRHEREVA
ncbi:hypothetical protein [Brevundimonas viscosa]|uniref:Uncharacterized protein n=1 Tax=Brevundimonas viscosa TaxID=871741 RepID=A0A1I6T7I7_9CAUL|nr:hypothetical protein [Brevundimonas viscosa]SFS85093.1 hypothetical protein SAMN05192570_3031 [Brevundimonas viscosa]